MEGGWKGLLQPYVTATPISIVSRRARRRRSSHNDRMVVSTEADEAGIKPQELVELPANDFIKWGGGDLSRAGVILQCMSHLEPWTSTPSQAQTCQGSSGYMSSMSQTGPRGYCVDISR